MDFFNASDKMLLERLLFSNENMPFCNLTHVLIRIILQFYLGFSVKWCITKDWSSYGEETF